jgi:biotin transport system substrate-specific component
MLAGIVLGARNGALAVILFIFIVALGAPLLAGGRGGLAVFFGPTVGFLLGWIPAAYVTGYLMERLRNLPVFAAAIIAAAVGGILVDYAFGIAGLMAVAHLSLGQALAAVVAFIPGDLLKVAAAALVAQAAVRTYPSALSSRA